MPSVFTYRRSLIGALFLALTTPLLAQEAKPQPSTFIRLQRDGNKQPTTLETATVRYVPANGKDGVVVDLIGVVHIGDRSYYDKLNQQMAQYDVVLYELVAKQGTRIPKGGKANKDNALGMVMQLAKLVLELDLQTERIDYTKKNFVHADLSPQEMAEAVKKRGDDGFTLFLSITADMLRQQNLQQMKRDKNPPQKEEDVDIMNLLGDPERAAKLKRMMAEQLVKSATGDGGFGKTLNTILISDRNAAAMKVFQKELAAGKKKIGIFYGAGHMADFEKRLRNDFGLKRDSEQWLTAWDIKKRKSDVEALIDLLKLLSDD
jgi:hypothetical protein